MTLPLAYIISLLMLRFSFIIVVAVIAHPLSSQSVDKLRLFLDCESCDNGYIKQQLNLVHYVRDRKVADVHLLITHQVAGNGGRYYELQFIGLKEVYLRKITSTHLRRCQITHRLR